MNIETRFNVNDSCYYMKDNKVVYSTVKRISIDVSIKNYDESDTSIKYYMDASDLTKSVFEDKLHRTKQELLATL